MEQPAEKMIIELVKANRSTFRQIEFLFDDYLSGSGYHALKRKPATLINYKKSKPMTEDAFSSIFVLCNRGKLKNE